MSNYMDMYTDRNNNRINWLIAVDKIKLGIDFLRFAFMSGVYWILNVLDLLQLGWQGVCTGIANFVGDLKANVLKLLQDMCNGAIDIINFFINALNKIPGVSIDTVKHVTFGAEAQLKNEAEKQARNGELQARAEEIARIQQDRENELNRLAVNAMNEHNKRQAEIQQAQAGDILAKRCKKYSRK